MTVASMMSDEQRLEVAAKAIEAAILDLKSARSEAQRYSLIAAGWAVVMLHCDILRDALSYDPRFAKAFDSLDKAIEKTNQFISYWGHTPLAKKADLLKTVDPQFQGATEMVENVRDAREMFTKAGIAPSKQLGTTLDLAQDMAEDTILLMNALNTGDQGSRSADNAIKTAEQQLKSIRRRLAIVRGNHQRPVRQREASRQPSMTRP